MRPLAWPRGGSEGCDGNFDGWHGSVRGGCKGWDGNFGGWGGSGGGTAHCDAGASATGGGVIGVAAMFTGVRQNLVR